MGAAAPEGLQTPVQFLKGIGPRRAKELVTVGVQTVEDLLLILPRRYEDREQLQPIGSLKPHEVTSVTGEVLNCGVRSTRRRGFLIFEMVVGDDSGRVRATFLNQSYLKDVFEPHQRVVLYGKVDPRRTGGLQMTNPDYEVVASGTEEDAEAIHTGRIVPVYEKIGSLTPRMHRRVVHHALGMVDATLDDPLPPMIRRSLGLLARAEALSRAHFPTARTSVEELNLFRTAAQQRLIFEEFFLFQVGLALRRRESDQRVKPRSITVNDRIRRAALDVLPFRLTGDQRSALKEIIDDLQRPQPMNRLLQGDVGSGKTIVALLAALVAMENGLQVAMMSPTEVLAEQHFANVMQTLSPARFTSVLLTGASQAKVRREAVEGLANGTVQLVVGTHALVQDDLRFDALGLVIIDEQHRFGVAQRAALREKGLEPDVLVMTATPIPRTLALTAYGDLDISDIRERLPGRREVQTLVRSESRRKEVYELVRGELVQGRQAFVVCPLVEESAKLDLKAATEMATELDECVFPEYRVGIVHGRVKSEDRARVMRAFARGEIDVLVATTVIEVGIDVPNATVMLVEQAERFGLAQLHQLRGRVGRGAAQSYCVLAHARRLSAAAKARLRAIGDTPDGFEIAERDLELRGPGDFFGTRQSGLPIFRVGNLIRDHRLMEDARRTAVSWLAEGGATDAYLKVLRAGWAKRYGLVVVG